MLRIDEIHDNIDIVSNMQSRHGDVEKARARIYLLVLD